MKKIISLALMTAMLVFALESPARAEYDPGVNYMSKMISAAAAGDYGKGLAAEQARGEKIRDMGLEHKEIRYEDLYLLAKIIYAEAGSYWLSDQWKMNVGEVVLNRVASPEFPNSISEVIYQPGQYYGRNSSYFQRLQPDERCVRLALRLLEGERNMIPAVVFQANFRQGSGVYASFYDSYLGWTYFCLSSYTYLYYA